MKVFKAVILAAWVVSSVTFYRIMWPLRLASPKAETSQYQATSSNFTNVITNTFGFGEIYDEDKRLRDARALYHQAKEYGALTNLVSLLTLSGEFCRIQGHAWCANLKGYPADQKEKPEWRECLVCGREEERARSDKPWHHSNP